MDAPLNNLPVQLTSFIGREREIAEVKRLLASTRLLTLTGSGGAGKTRLVIQVATNLSEQYANGAWFVDLAPLNDSSLVAQAIASVFELRESADLPLVTVLINYLRAKNLLIVLDNCEHLIVSCAQVVDSLLRACPSLSILATSREVLGIAGETAFRVPSLSLPDSPSMTIEEFKQSEAVKLFTERATAANHDFQLTKSNALSVAQICQRLDGMPLAIELAAARVRSLSIEQIAARLDDRFRLLTQGSRTAPTRQKTLRAAIDWSYGLLSEQERDLFRQLAVFAGGWTLQAAEEVCNGQSTVVDTLTALVDKSLVVIEQKDSDVRYRFLETIRQYAHEKFAQAEASGWASVRTRHLDYFLKLAEEAEPKIQSADEKAWRVRLENDYGNLRAAWEWAIETDTEKALRLAWALLEFWGAGWHLPEAQDWLASLLPRTEGWGDSVERARALIAAGTVAFYQRNSSVAYELLNQGLMIANKCELKFEIGRASLWLGVSAYFLSNFETAHNLFDTSLAVSRELGNLFYMGRSQFGLAMLARDQGEFELAQQLHNESIEKFRELGNDQQLGVVLNSMGEVARLQGDYQRATKLYQEAIRLERESGRKIDLAQVTANLGFVLLREGDYAKARTAFETNLILTQELGQIQDTWLCLAGMAGVINAMGKAEQAMRLLQAIEASIRKSKIVFQRSDRTDYDYIWECVSAQLDEATIEKARVEGRTMTLEQAIVYARTETAGIASPTPSLPHDPSALTPREVEVLRLVADGLSDAQIAERLVISPRTVNTHLSSIYSKLGVKSRSAATRYALDHKLV